MSLEKSGYDVRLITFTLLREKNGSLRGRLAALYEEREYILRIVIPDTQIRYLIKVGTLQVEVLCKRVDVMRTQRKIEMMRERVEKKTLHSVEEIEQLLLSEYREWDEKIACERTKIEEAKALFSSLAPFDDVTASREIFRHLAGKLAPEVNSAQSAEAKALWPQVRLAYALGDIFRLRALSIVAEDYPESYDLPSDLGAIQSCCNVLEKRIERMTEYLNNIKQHPAFEWKRLLSDASRLREEQKRLEGEINDLKMQKKNLADIQYGLELELFVSGQNTWL